MFYVTAFGFAGCILLLASLMSLLVFHLSHSCLSFCHVDVVSQLSPGIAFHNSQLFRRIGFPSASKCLPLLPSCPSESFPDCFSFVSWLPSRYGPPNVSLLVSLAFICLLVCLVLSGSPDVSLYLSPFMCLVVCLYKCPALHLTPESRWVSIVQKLGGITASPSLRICAPGSGKNFVPHRVSQRVSPFDFHLVSHLVFHPVVLCVSHFVPDIVPHFVSQHVSDCISNFAPRCVFQCVLHCASPPACPIDIHRFVSMLFSTLSSAFFHFCSNL